MKENNRSQNEVLTKKNSRKSNKKIGVAIVALVAVAILLSSLFAYVPVGAIGVMKTLGAPTGRTLPNGVHMKIPFIQGVENVDVRIQRLDVLCKAVSMDLQEVNSTIAVNYRPNANNVVDIVRYLGAQLYVEKILAPAIQESVKATTAQYTAEGLITERARVSAEIQQCLEDRVNPHGISIEEFNIVNFDFSEAFNKAIEEKQVAQQDLIRIQTEQEQLIVKAEAAARAAEEEARAILVRAEAQAEANRQLAASLTPNLVEYEKIQKWDGILPRVSGGNAIVDFRDNH